MIQTSFKNISRNAFDEKTKKNSSIYFDKLQKKLTIVVLLMKM